MVKVDPSILKAELQVRPICKKGNKWFALNLSQLGQNFASVRGKFSVT